MCLMPDISFIHEETKRVLCKKRRVLAKSGEGKAAGRMPFLASCIDDLT